MWRTRPGRRWRSAVPLMPPRPDGMAQNIYDNDEFFAGYARLPRSVEGLAGAPEWPSLRALLPELRGAKVLDLGCGYCWFCRWARAAGPAPVLGNDGSVKVVGRGPGDHN